MRGLTRTLASLSAAIPESARARDCRIELRLRIDLLALRLHCLTVHLATHHLLTKIGELLLHRGILRQRIRDRLAL